MSIISLIAAIVLVVVLGRQYVVTETVNDSVRGPVWLAVLLGAIGFLAYRLYRALKRRPRRRLASTVVMCLFLVGCTAQDQQIAINAGNAAACGWLATTGGIRQCGGTPESRLTLLSDAQRAEIESVAKRAYAIDPVATELAMASLASTAAALEVVARRLLKIANEAPAQPVVQPATP